MLSKAFALIFPSLVLIYVTYRYIKLFFKYRNLQKAISLSIIAISTKYRESTTMDFSNYQKGVSDGLYWAKNKITSETDKIDEYLDLSLTRK